jgi:hypothetical protein
VPTRRKTLRLRAGHLLYPGPDGAWRLATADGGLLRLTPSPERVAALAEVLAGEAPPDRLAEVGDLLDEMAAAGFLEAERPAAGSPPGRVDVAVCPGPGERRRRELAATLAGVLAEAGVVVAEAAGGGGEPGAGGEPPAVRIELAGWLPDARWRRLDAWCEERGIAWHRCYQEGTSVHLGPLTVPGATAGWADQRARRLAAADHPAELESAWSHLDAGRGVPDPPALDPAARAAVAAALVADVLAYFRGDAIVSTGCETALDLPTFAWRRHPVHPVPRNLLREAPP